MLGNLIKRSKYQSIWKKLIYHTPEKKENVELTEREIAKIKENNDLLIKNIFSTMTPFYVNRMSRFGDPVFLASKK